MININNISLLNNNNNFDNVILEYNNIKYKIIKEYGIGFRKKAFLAYNLISNEKVIIFIPCITNTYNNLEVNKLHFLNSIDTLLYHKHYNSDKLKIIPLYTSKNDYVIIIQFISGGTFYKYLCDN